MSENTVFNRPRAGYSPHFDPGYGFRRVSGHCRTPGDGLVRPPPAPLLDPRPHRLDLPELHLYLSGRRPDGEPPGESGVLDDDDGAPPARVPPRPLDPRPVRLLGR